MITDESLQVELFIRDPRTAMECEHFLRMIGLVPIIIRKEEDISTKEAISVTDLEGIKERMIKGFYDIMDTTSVTEISEFKKILQERFEEDMTVFNEFLESSVPIVTDKNRDAALKKILKDKFGKEAEVFDELFKIFQEADLCTTFNIIEMRYAVYCFLSRRRGEHCYSTLVFDKTTLAERREKLVNATKKLKICLGSDSDNYFVRYATIYCMTQANMLASFVRFKRDSIVKIVNDDLRKMPTIELIASNLDWDRIEVVSFTGIEKLDLLYPKCKYFSRRKALQNYVSDKALAIYKESGDYVAYNFLLLCFYYREGIGDKIKKCVEKVLEHFERMDDIENYYFIYIVIELLVTCQEKRFHLERLEDGFFLKKAIKIFERIGYEKIKNDYTFLFGEIGEKYMKLYDRLQEFRDYYGKR